MLNWWIVSILWLVLALSMFALTPPPAFAITFNTFDVPGAVDTFALAINARGQIVGYYVEASTNLNHGFLLDHGTLTTIDRSYEHTNPRHQR
jgi:hypothetical protein